ncbi:MAG: SRPBCC domain-containing protein [Acidimicrobiales bacterium]
MTTNEADAGRILGSLRAADGNGVVRVADGFGSGIDDVWSALTDPARLARWYGQVEGDLRPGGQFRIYVEADDWEGTGRVEVCEQPLRLVVTTRETEESWRKGHGAEPFDATIEATLSVQGDRTALVVEVGGLPLDKIAFYGVGWQIHAENLAAHLAGGEHGDVEARWDELLPAYQDLAADVGS